MAFEVPTTDAHVTLNHPGEHSMPHDTYLELLPKPQPKRFDWSGFLYAGLGLVFVPLINSTILTRNIGWILESIVHEGGHTLMALAMGQPALPRITFDGHVPFTVIGPTQYIAVCIVVWAALAWLTFKAYQNQFLRVTATILVVAYPIFAFSEPRRQLAILLAGHGGELLFAGIALWRAQTGLFTANQLERAAYSVVGWYLVFLNIFLWSGILYDPIARDQYTQGPEEGHINDIVVATFDVLVWTDVRWLAAFMLIVSISIYPLALLYSRGAKG